MATDVVIQAISTVVVVFIGMRVLYGSWPWEGRKTWYATGKLLRASVQEDGESIRLSLEQIVHAKASIAAITNGQLVELSETAENPQAVIEEIEKTKSPGISGTNGNPLVVEIRACGDPTVNQPNPLVDAVVSIQTFIEEKAAMDAKRAQGGLALASSG
jgi:hypothetical protein